MPLKLKTARPLDLKVASGPLKPRVTATGNSVKAEHIKRLYDGVRWKRLREKIMERDGMRCRQTGIILAGYPGAPNSPIVDHIIPHRGDLGLFYDPNNLQLVSKEWHDSVKQRVERSAPNHNGF